MKNKIIVPSVTGVLLCFLFGFYSPKDTRYYYTYNEKTFLSEIPNKLIIRYNENKHSNLDKVSLDNLLKKQYVQWPDDSTIIVQTINISDNEFIKKKAIDQMDVKSCYPLYTSNSIDELGLTDEFVIKLNDGIDPKEIEALNKNFKVEIVESNGNCQLLKVSKGDDVLSIANSYQESGLTRYSYPNFISKLIFDQVIPNDTYFANQFYLHNTGQVFTDGHSGTIDADIDAPEAWTMTKGSPNIIIAVIDQGVTSDHLDLPNTRQVRLPNSNTYDGNPNDPSPTGNDNHGNSCAGIIAATQGNSQGISGIAPLCKIMPIRPTNSSGYITPSKLAGAFSFARQNGAHIISCSWTLASDNPNYWPSVRDTIIAATGSHGRNGLGCIVVISAGNTANHAIGHNGYIQFPANVNSPYVITVGSSDRDDHQANYSPTGDPNSQYNQIIDIVAPSNRAFSYEISGETKEVWTIDIPNDAGDNSVHYTDGGTLPTVGEILPSTGTNYLSYTARFGGTSASAPQVAAVAALILSINPNLYLYQVWDCLVLGADKVGGYTYTNGKSNEFGYGRLNACASARQALLRTCSVGGPRVLCTTGGYSANVPQGDTVVWSSTSNLSLVSGQNSNSAVFQKVSNGNGYVYATLNTACGPIVLSTPVHTGPYSSSDYPISGPSSALCRSYVYYSIPSLTDVTSINWTWPGGWTYVSGQNTPNLALRTGTSGGMVAVGVNNICGQSGSYATKYTSVYGSCGYSLVISPNPSSDIVYIIINDQVISNNDSTLSLLTNNLSLEKQISYKVTITDYLGYVYFNGTKYSKSFSIPVQNLKNGNYIISINDGENQISGQFIVKH